MIPDEQDQIQKRQRSRALVTALALGAFGVLMYFISIAKMASQ